MVNIGEISKSGVDPAFVRKSKASKKSRQAVAVESAAKATPVKESEDLSKTSSTGNPARKKPGKKALGQKKGTDKTVKKAPDTADEVDQHPNKRIDFRV